jgi:uncharacterized C2H2 Zn-finger protein
MNDSLADWRGLKKTISDLRYVNRNFQTLKNKGKNGLKKKKKKTGTMGQLLKV